MRTYTGFALLVFAITALAMAQAEPAYAAQPAAGVNNAMLAVDNVVGAHSQIPAQLVRGGRGGGVGHVGVRAGVGSFRAARFNNFRFHNFRHFRHFRHFRPFVGAYPYYTYYDASNCYWDGYTWVCDDYNY